jgi:hypothetical protein
MRQSGEESTTISEAGTDVARHRCDELRLANVVVLWRGLWISLLAPALLTRSHNAEDVLTIQ